MIEEIEEIKREMKRKDEDRREFILILIMATISVLYFGAHYIVYLIKY